MPLVSRSTDATLLDRELELDHLRAALGAARDGDGRLVLVEGVAGVGRSALLCAAAEDARRRGMTVLGAAGDRAEQAYPHALLLQLLEDTVAGLTAAERDAAFSGPAATVAGLLDGRGAPETFDAVHGVFRLVANLAAQRPVALVVDDVQWGDEASLLALGYLARRVGDLPVAMLLGARDAEPGTAEAVTELAADAGVTVVRPGPLGDAAATRLVTAALGEAADPDRVTAVVGVGLAAALLATALMTRPVAVLFAPLLAPPPPRLVPASLGEPADPDRVTTVVDAAGGSPLLLRALVEPGARTPVPEPVVRWVQRRLDVLGATAFRLTRALAVLRDDARVEQVAELAGLDATAAAGAADTLAALGLVTGGERIAFAEPLVRDAILITIPGADRRALHARAARLLRRDGASPEVVTEQVLRATVLGDAWVVRLLRRQATAALAAGDRDRADLLLGRALDEPVAAGERGALLAQLGELRAGHATGEAVELLERALELVEDRTVRVDAHRALADALVAAGRHRRAEAVIHDGLALAGDAEPELTRRLQASLVLLGAVRPEFDVEADADRLPVPTTPVLTVAERTELVAAAARGCFELEPHDACLSLARQALDGERLDVGDGPDAMRWAVAKAVLVWGDDLPAALAVCDRALLRLRRQGNRIGVATARGCRATPAYWSGRLAEATADAEGALTETTAGWQPWFGLAGTVLVACHLERGDVATAAAVLEEVERRAGDAPEFVAYARYARAQLRLAEGDRAGALEDFVAAGTAMPHPNPAALPWRSQAALVAHRLGDRDRAAALVREELDLARRFGAARPIGMALRVAGVTTADPVAGRARLVEAVAVLRGSSARLELGRALCDLGESMLAEGDAIAAREPLREALGLADDAGAVLLVKRARQSLVQAGGRPRRAAQSGSRALTTAERRVGELAARGMTNREIADRLVVTRKTVTFHLSSVYRKLGVSSRAELKRLLG